MLSLSPIIDTARRNGIVWDAVIPCKMLRVYKTRPEAYRLAAKYLAVSPEEILMVACHNFDLDAARDEGYRTAFARRPDEWGPADRPTRCRIRHAISSSTALPSLPTFLSRDRAPRAAIHDLITEDKKMGRRPV
jgi:FMN phosphatase YigB (HAD superfamily)